MNKPPLGLKPENLYREECDKKRVRQIIAAIKRYTDARKQVPAEWYKELNKLTS